MLVFHIEGGGALSVPAADGQNILEAARTAGVVIDAPCSGSGVCGKCRVRVMSGSVQSERSAHISSDDWNKGWRLACRSAANGDADIFVPASASAFASGMRVAAFEKADRAMFEREFQELREAGIVFGTPYFTCVLELDEPTLDDPEPDAARVARAMRAKGFAETRFTGAAIRELPRVLRANGFRVSLVCERDGERVRVFAVRAPGKARACGAAIDVGTTSVAALLCDLETGEILARASAGNGQICYGADVINRIIESNRDGGTERLRQAVLDDTLVPMLGALVREAGAEPADIVRASVAGNTTMEHLLIGVYADPIRTEPYVPAFLELSGLNAYEIGLPVHPDARVTFAPNVGSYVGGDISAGVLAASLWARNAITLFIDLGTNGELVLGGADFLMCCACSAGPAFEGGEISCGMRATDGAVEKVTLEGADSAPRFEVIGGGAPAGLCGSGIIDLIAELFRVGALGANGKLRDGARVRRDEHGIARYILAEAADGRSEVSITDVDVDNFIRAMAAIYSAVDAMLEALSMDVSAIELIEVAGGIGSGINMDNAVAIGMFPDIDRSRYVYVDNTSLAGACASLLSADAEEKLGEIGRSMTYLELSTHPGYMDKFVAACFLPHTDASLFPSQKREG